MVDRHSCIAKEGKDLQVREAMLGLVALWAVPGAHVPSEDAHSLISTTLSAIDTVSDATGVSVAAQKKPLQHLSL